MDFVLYTLCSSLGIVTKCDYDSPSSANSVNILGDVSHLSFSQLEDLGIGLNVGIAWEEALHSALMPITPQASMGSLADSESCDLFCMAPPWAVV